MVVTENPSVDVAKRHGYIVDAGRQTVRVNSDTSVEVVVEEADQYGFHEVWLVEDDFQHRKITEIYSNRTGRWDFIGSGCYVTPDVSPKRVIQAAVWFDQFFRAGRASHPILRTVKEDK